MPDGSDDCYQGSDLSSDQNALAQELDLFAISERTKELWKLPDRSSTHRAIEILIRKGLSWDHSEQIMNRIRSSIGNADISPANLTMTDKTLKRWGLSADKISGIRKILSLPTVNSQTLCSIKEGGIYLVKLFKVLDEEDDDTWPHDDFNILRNLGILFFRPRLLTSRESLTLSKNWAPTRSQVAYFLHRLKPEGASKIMIDDELEPWDFWGVDKPIIAPTKESDGKNEILDDECPSLVSSNE